jgi:hypothetical protein
MEKIALESGHSIEMADMATLEELWRRAKKATT